MMHGKAIWKPGVGETAKASGVMPKVGVTAPHMNLSAARYQLLVMA